MTHPRVIRRMVITKHQAGQTYKQIATDMPGTSLDSVGKIVRLWKLTHSADRLPSKSRARRADSQLSISDVAWLERRLDRHSRLYNWELKILFERFFGRRVSVKAIERALHHLSRKKITKAFKKRVLSARKQYCDAILNSGWPVDYYLFWDETAKDRRSDYRLYGRAVKSKRAYAYSDFERGVRHSCIAVFGYDIGAIWKIYGKGTINSQTILEFAQEFLLGITNEFPGKHSVVVLDNAKWHRSLRQFLEDRGRVVLYLPTYSPDFNPIEKFFANVKQWCRMFSDSFRAAGFSEIDIIHEAFKSRTIAEINKTILSVVYDPELGE